MSLDVHGVSTHAHPKTRSPLSASRFCSGSGGSTSGPLNSSLEGRLDPLGLSPEAAEWVTPDSAAGHRASGYNIAWGGEWSQGLGPDPESEALYAYRDEQDTWWLWVT